MPDGLGLLPGLATAWLALEVIGAALGLVALIGVGLYVLLQLMKGRR